MIKKIHKSNKEG